MESNHKSYEFENSLKRIDDILDYSGNDYDNELSQIPAESKLTYTNGFYVDCSAVFIDLRDSKGLTTKFSRPVMAKIYRSFISECTAIINENEDCKYLFIEGDCVWGIFEAQYKSQIDSCVITIARLNSLMHVLNIKIKKKGWKNFEPIKAGIGAAYGNSLLIKSGASGTGINEPVWIGKIIGTAAKYAGMANKNGVAPIIASASFVENLESEEYKKLFNINYSISGNYYTASIINTLMDKWVEKNS